MVAFGKGHGGLENQIICLKYLMFFFNVISWVSLIASPVDVIDCVSRSV
jgi:hypothetical protein